MNDNPNDVTTGEHNVQAVIDWLDQYDPRDDAIECPKNEVPADIV